MKPIVALVLAALLLPSLAGAASTNKSCKEQRRKNPQAVCLMDIEEEEVGGSRVVPLGDGVFARRELRHPSLLRLRVDFEDKILASAEDM